MFLKEQKTNLFFFYKKIQDLSPENGGIDHSRAYACVGFSYEDKSSRRENGTTDVTHSNCDKTDEPKEKLFVADDALQLPTGMLVVLNYSFYGEGVFGVNFNKLCVF